MQLLLSDCGLSRSGSLQVVNVRDRWLLLPLASEACSCRAGRARLCRSSLRRRRVATTRHSSLCWGQYPHALPTKRCWVARRSKRCSSCRGYPPRHSDSSGKSGLIWHSLYFFTYLLTHVTPIHTTPTSRNLLLQFTAISRAFQSSLHSAHSCNFSRAFR